MVAHVTLRLKEQVTNVLMQGKIPGVGEGEVSVGGCWLSRKG
jgi:hypothetical protein